MASSNPDRRPRRPSPPAPCSCRAPRADKAARLVAPDEPVVLLGPPSPFVGRGGQKLEAALERFAIVADGRRALDAGASTGGFTDCLLQHGAAHVYAVDVGHGQLHQSPAPRPPGHRPRTGQRAHPDRGGPGCRRSRGGRRRHGSRLRALPARGGRSVLHFAAHRGPRPDGPGGAPEADLVLLVKPQFEAGRAAVARGKGVVRDPAVWLEALEGVASALLDARTGIMGAMVSPLTGPAGNVEFLVHARKGAARSRCRRGRRPAPRRRGGGGRDPCHRPRRPTETLADGDRHLPGPPRPPRRPRAGHRHGRLADRAGRRGPHPPVHRARPGQRGGHRRRPRATSTSAGPPWP